MVMPFVRYTLIALAGAVAGTAYHMAEAATLFKCETPGKTTEYRDSPCKEGKQTDTGIPASGYGGTPFPAGYILFDSQPGASYVLDTPRNRHEIYAAQRLTYPYSRPDYRPHGYQPSMGYRDHGHRRPGHRR